RVPDQVTVRSSLAAGGVLPGRGPQPELAPREARVDSKGQGSRAKSRFIKWLPAIPFRRTRRAYPPNLEGNKGKPMRIGALRAGLAVALFCLISTPVLARDLTFEDRVKAQE